MRSDPDEPRGMGNFVTDEEVLRELLGEPSEIVRGKVSDHLTELMERFVVTKC